MKRIRSALALAAAVCVLLSGCGSGNGTPAEDGGKGGIVTENPPDGDMEPVEASYGIPTWPASAEYGPGYGELPGRIGGSFYTGQTVAFNYGAFTASNDGIYFIDAAADAVDPILIVEDTLIFDTAICTDGFTVCYVNASGELIEASLEDGGQRQVTDGADFPYFSGVVGVGENLAYVQIPGAYENAEELGDLDSVCAVSLETGEIVSSWDWMAGAGCAGGYTALYGLGYDMSPRRLLVFAPDGTAVVDEEWAMGASVTGGEIWYSSVDDEGSGPLSLCRVTEDGPAVMLVWTPPENATPYGIFPWGFLASAYYTDGEGNAQTVRYDMRTMEPSDVPEDISAFEGYTLGGREYLVGTSEVYLWEDGQASCIFETPGDLRYDPILLCGEHVLLDGGNGEFYIFPLDPDNTVHPIHVTAALDTLEEYDGKNGATVTGYYPLLLDDYGFTWDALAESLADYNAAAYETTRSNAAECASQASDLIENGFASPEDPFSVSTRVYIQRADTLAFSFVEHQTMDNRVNRGAMDLKTGYNLDPADGHDLTLDEVIADEAALQAILLDNLVETGFCQRDEGEEFLLQIFRTRSLTSTDQFSWVLGYEGVSFYFNGNINFPYAPGAYKVTIPFAEYPDLFNSKYFTTPDRYAYDLLLDGYFSEEYQVQSEAGSVPLLLTTSASDGEEKLFVLYNDESYTIPLDGAPVSAALVHIDGGAASAGQPRTGGGSFLMVQTDDNGYLLDVIDLDTGCVEAWDFGEAVLPQNLLVNRQWDYAAMGPEPSSVWLSNPDCFSVLYYDQATSSYTVRGLYDFNGGTPRLLDVFRSSLAVG